MTARIAALALLATFTTAAFAQRSIEQVGDSLYSHFDNVGALDAYRSALANDSSFGVMFKRAVAANELAQDLEAEGDRARAEEMYNTAVDYAVQVRDRYPDEAGSWFILAATTGKLAQFSGGRSKVRIGRAVEEYYRKSLEIDSTYALAYLVGGIFNRELAQLSWIQKLAAKALFGGLPEGDLEQSRAMLERAIELDRTLFMAHWELAQTYEALGMPDRAQSHLRFLRVLSPRSSEEARIRRRVLSASTRQTE